MNRIVALATALLLSATPAAAQGAAPHAYVPPNGFVPDSATAVRIAEAVLIPIYGAQQVASEYPFVAALKANVWTVTGSLPPAPPGYARLGGVAEVEIAKRDGRILRLSHGR